MVFYRVYIGIYAWYVGKWCIIYRFFICFNNYNGLTLLIDNYVSCQRIEFTVTLAPAIERLGINPYQWGTECLSGDVHAGPATSFPQSIGMVYNLTQHPTL